MFKTVLSIEGMACPKCEAHMNEAVRSAFKVKSVESSHKDKQTVIISKDPIDESLISNAVASAGYKLLNITTEELEKKGFALFGKR